MRRSSAHSGAFHICFLHHFVGNRTEKRYQHDTTGTKRVLTGATGTTKTPPAAQDRKSKENGASPHLYLVRPFAKNLQIHAVEK